MKRYYLCCLLLTLAFILSSCGADEPSETPDVPEPHVEAEEVKSEEKAENYDEIEVLFADIAPDAELTVKSRSGAIYVGIKTNWPNEKSDTWEETVSALNSAMETAEPLAADYGAKTVSVELFSEDETILASGFQGAVKYNLFEEREQSSASNPPTITKFEYDQIAVGMTLTEVREIVGGPGTLQSQIGEITKYSDPVSTYRWYGEKDGSYADILFDGYEVYSKVELFLE